MGFTSRNKVKRESSDMVETREVDKIQARKGQNQYLGQDEEAFEGRIPTIQQYQDLVPKVAKSKVRDIMH